MNSPKNTSSKTILVIGPSTGFGRGAVEALPRVGYRVIASMRGIASAGFEEMSEIDQ